MDYGHVSFGSLVSFGKGVNVVEGEVVALVDRVPSDFLRLDAKDQSIAQCFVLSTDWEVAFVNDKSGFVHKLFDSHIVLCEASKLISGEDFVALRLDVLFKYVPYRVQLESIGCVREVGGVVDLESFVVSPEE